MMSDPADCFYLQITKSAALQILHELYHCDWTTLTRQFVRGLYTEDIVIWADRIYVLGILWREFMMLIESHWTYRWALGLKRKEKLQERERRSPWRMLSRRMKMKVFSSSDGKLAGELRAPQTCLRWKVAWDRWGIWRGELRPPAPPGRWSPPPTGSTVTARRSGRRQSVRAGRRTPSGRRSATTGCVSQSSWWDL